MNTLGSPLEALAFNYLSYGFLTAVNNVWTWIAVLTAAVSFWRIKTLSLSVPSTFPRPDFPNRSSNLPAPPRGIILPPSAPVERLPAEPASTLGGEPSKPANAATTSFCAWERESLTKGKFTAYFDGEDERDGNVGGIENIYDREGGGDGDGDVLASGLGNEWYESWERVMQTKTGEAGWYRCQDLTAINGNVVRLWGGGCRRRSATALVAVGRVVSTW